MNLVKGGMKSAAALAHLRLESLVGVSEAAQGDWAAQPRAGQGSRQQPGKLPFPEHRAGEVHVAEEHTAEACSFLWM